MSKIILAKHTYCRNAFRMYKISVVLIFCGIVFALFQIFYIPQLELKQSDIEKIILGMDFQDVLNITRIEIIERYISLGMVVIGLDKNLK